MSRRWGSLGGRWESAGKPKENLRKHKKSLGHMGKPEENIANSMSRRWGIAGKALGPALGERWKNRKTRGNLKENIFKASAKHRSHHGVCGCDIFRLPEGRMAR